jgi:hypothetical protein
MPLILPGNVGSATAATTFDVANSCRFDDGSSTRLTKTPGSDGDLDNWTFSCWVKRGNITTGTAQCIFSCDVDSSTNYGKLVFDTSDRLEFHNSTGGTVDKLITNRLFRDCSAWYHIVAVWDSDNGTEAQRMRLYINGVEETSFNTANYPTSGLNSAWNQDSVHSIGDINSGQYFDGYIAEAVFTDGQVYAASDFGEFDEDSPTIWKPKDVSGLTFGTNGAYLDFKDSDNLGDDESGNTNDWTETNIAAVDQCVDSPTNNFATWNPILRHHSSMTLAEGNLQSVTANGYSDDVSHSFFSTQAMTAGKWVAEFKVTEDGNIMLGVSNDIDINQGGTGTNTYNFGYVASGYAYSSSNGQVYTSDSGSSYGDTYTTDDIIGIYLDLDNNKLYFSKNGTVQNSGTGVSITACDGTNPYFFCHSDYESAGTNTVQANFGSPIHSITSGNADANDYGNFEYTTTITGDASSKSFLSLCTKNLGSDGG